ncbi:hypothetical protein [Segnochrobactrum spirostomi]|uniref:hypothetical protein n=1 Tax=Segnochrobactrum spirostomi TaxID=2608987 RepID=UPI0028AAD13C|nr:hypothetical protein [Segnochrobactrum spirostomi]
MDLRYFVDAGGDSPFEAWFSALDSMAAAKVAVALARLEQGNLGNVKSVGAAFSNIGSIGGPATGSISVVTATP